MLPKVKGMASGVSYRPSRQLHLQLKLIPFQLLRPLLMEKKKCVKDNPQVKSIENLLPESDETSHKLTKI